MNDFNTGDFNWESIREAIRKGKALARVNDRNAGMIAEIQCQVCFRKAIPMSTSHVLVCSHLYEALKERVKVVEKEMADMLGIPNPPFNYSGITFEIFDDGPARF